MLVVVVVMVEPRKLENFCTKVAKPVGQGEPSIDPIQQNNPLWAFFTRIR